MFQDYGNEPDTKKKNKIQINLLVSKTLIIYFSQTQSQI